MKLSDFDYELPKTFIAQYPPEARGSSRLMVLDRNSHRIYDRNFIDIIEYFDGGDCLVLNDTKVIHARLMGRRGSGGKVEVLLLEKLEDDVCHVLLRPGKKLKENETIFFGEGNLSADFMERRNPGGIVKFEPKGGLKKALAEVGLIPLPPYIRRTPEDLDEERYQTVYATREGATAAPTAGLHFTQDILHKFRDRGVDICNITLHTSYGTFAPIREEEIEKHEIHREHYELPQQTADIVNEAKEQQKSVFCVGTTTCRTLESCVKPTNNRYALHANQGSTDLYIYPGYEFKITGHLITNFHLPKSTLLLLVCAFAGREFIFEAYRKAIEKGYRFFSYGDSMLIL